MLYIPRYGIVILLSMNLEKKNGCVDDCFCQCWFIFYNDTFGLFNKLIMGILYLFVYPALYLYWIMIVMDYIITDAVNKTDMLVNEFRIKERKC